MQILNLEKLEMLKDTTMKGIRSIKFLKEEYLGPMKQTLFQSLFPISINHAVSSRIGYYKSIKDW